MTMIMSRRPLCLRNAPVVFAALMLLLPFMLPARFPSSSSSVSTTSFLLPVVAAEERGGSVVDEGRCPRCPICSTRGTPFFLKMRYCVLTSLPGSWAKREFAFENNEKIRRRIMKDLEELLLTRLVGQAQIKNAILDAVRRKLAFPNEPLILHFAGDNGVGKTHTARLLSLAMSLYCAPSRPGCDAGDNMLVISGTGFDGMTIEDARSRIIKRVVEHQKIYPHGIVLLDDLTVMHPKLVASLAPLLGRAERFAEQPDNSLSLSQLTVVVTTDFGQQGRTWGKSIAEIERLVRDDFATLYGTLVPAFTRTMLFLAFTRRDAEQMVRFAVTALPCSTYWGGGAVVASSIEDIAVSFLVERYRETWEGRENGHALRRAVEDSLLSLLLQYFEKHGQDKFVWARFRLNQSSAVVVLNPGESNDELNEIAAEL